MTPARASIEERAAFDFVRYASVWEDADVLCEALAPVSRDGRLLSIASAGDNVLALLTLDPREVVAVDLSVAQLACVELRIVAFRMLEDAALLEFLGFPPDLEAGADAGAGIASRRAACYTRLRTGLSARAAAFWDSHPEEVAGGIIHAGKFERYFQRFRRNVLPLVHGSATVAALRLPRSASERERFYHDRWDTWRWRALFGLFFSRFVMGRLGRDPAFFAQVEGAVAERILGRTRHALTELPTATNPWLAYILTGNFRPEALPPYVRPENRAVIRARLDRVRLEHGAAEAVDGPFDGMNLSDVFEYMNRQEYQACYAALLERARPAARLVYWNMLVPRARPAALARRVRPLNRLAAELHARDRAWFYQQLHVDEVLAP